MFKTMEKTSFSEFRSISVFSLLFPVFSKNIPEKNSPIETKINFSNKEIPQSSETSNIYTDTFTQGDSHVNTLVLVVSYRQVIFNG